MKFRGDWEYLEYDWEITTVTKVYTYSMKLISFFMVIGIVLMAGQYDEKILVSMIDEIRNFIANFQVDWIISLYDHISIF